MILKMTKRRILFFVISILPAHIVLQLFLASQNTILPFVTRGCAGRELFRVLDIFKKCEVVYTIHWDYLVS